MADSKRLTVLKALSAFLLETIQKSNGYKHDLKAVSRGRIEYTRDDPIPMLSILEDTDVDRFPRRTNREGRAPLEATGWSLLVQGWVSDDDANPTDPAYELLADTRKALAILQQDGTDPETGRFDVNPYYRLGGLIAGLTMEPGVCRPPAEGVSSKAFFYMRVTLEFVEDINDPYDLTNYR